MQLHCTHMTSVLCMFIYNVFHSKIIYYQCELYGTPLVRPQTWCHLAFGITVLLQYFFEQLLGNQAFIWEAIHSTVAFNIYISFLRCNLYALMTLSDMSLILSLRYSYRVRGVLRQKFLIPIVNNLAPEVDTMLFRRSFTLRRSAVSVPQSLF